jgi:hypothetical protein
VGNIALVLGAFLLVLAVASRFYMYDRLAVVPDNTQTTSISATAPGDDAEYLDVAAGPAVVEGPLQSTRVINGNVKLSEEASDDLGRDIAVWDTYSCTDTPDFDCGSGETPLSGTTDRVAFDATTGETVDWSGTRTESGGNKSRGSFQGLYFKFPFDTQKKDYEFWDGTLKRATPAVYVGEGEIDGLDVLEFEQVIEPTKTGTIAIPGSLIDEDESTVVADRIYSNKRTFKVEPVTGVIIVGGESQDSYLELDGERVLTTTQATLQYTDENTADTVDEYSGTSALLAAVHTTFPIVGGIVGLLLIVAGLLMRRGRADRDREDTPPAPKSRQSAHA